MRKTSWYKLDNIGKFYSATKSNFPIIFRYSVTLTEEVDANLLQEALTSAINDYPSFNCTLNKGFFWYYLEKVTKPYQVEEEKTPICYKMYKDSEDLLYRVNYYKNRINLEVSHILSDGRGTLGFFKNIIYRYLNLKYNLKVETEDNSSIYEKTEDSFDKYYTGPSLRTITNKRIYHYRSRKKKDTTFLEYHISLTKFKDLAKKYQVTITSLIIAVWIKSFEKVMKEREKKKALKIDVPVDLRTIFPSTTSRNFFGLTSIIYDNYNLSLQDIATKVNELLKENTKKDKIQVRMNQMISLEKNIGIRIVPSIIKDIALRITDDIVQNNTTSSVSNIGKIEVNKKLSPYIKNFNVLTSTKYIQMTICSYEDDLSIGMSSRYINNDIIKNFCNILKDNNITGIMNINEEDSYEKM